MAFNKAHLYNKFDICTSHFMHAISHPARICIIRQLSKRGPCTVEELLVNHPLSQPTLSQHIEILRKANLVLYREEYPYVIYSINKVELRKLKKHMKQCLLSL